MAENPFTQAFLKRRQELEAQRRFDAQLQESQADRGLRSQALAAEIDARKAADLRQQQQQEFEREQAETSRRWQAVTAIGEGKVAPATPQPVFSPGGIMGLGTMATAPPPASMNIPGLGAVAPVPMEEQARRHADIQLEASKRANQQRSQQAFEFANQLQKEGYKVPDSLRLRLTASMMGATLPKEEWDDYIIQGYNRIFDSATPPKEREMWKKVVEFFHSIHQPRGAGLEGLSTLQTMQARVWADRAMNNEQIKALMADPKFATSPELQRQALSLARNIVNSSAPEGIRGLAMEQAFKAIHPDSAMNPFLNLLANGLNQGR